MTEKKIEPICIYDQNKMVFGSSDRFNIRLSCPVCSNHIFMPVDKLLCPVCFSNLFIGANNWICSNSECSSYSVHQLKINGNPDIKMIITIKWTPTDTKLGTFQIYRNGTINNCSLYDPKIITNLGISIIAKYLADNKIRIGCPQ